MKSSFLCIVTLITCSGCVIGDLEFYPDYTRPEVPEEEWVKDQPLNPEFQNYLEEQRSALYQQERTGLPYLGLNRGKQEDLAWPSAAAQSIFKNQNLARRISELTRNLEEPSRKPQYYFKTHGLSREQENRFNAYNTFEDRNTGDFMPRFKPNFHILDDVRLNSDADNSDFSLPNDEVNVESEHHGRRPEQPPADQRSARFDEEKSEEFEEKPPRKLVLSKANGDDPTEFAYPPSDPRYFEESTPIEVKTSKYEKEEVEKSDSRGNADSIQIHNRNDDGYYHQQSLTGLRDPDRRFDDSLEVVAVKPHPGDDTTGVYIIAIVAGISAAATVGLIAFGIGWYNLQKHVKNASDVEYPAYGVTGPNKDISPSGDRRLAQSAQMYHYQHQKQQIIAMESRAAASERHGSVSEADSDEENEEGDYTVYECPGLAPTGEMEVKNPLFQDDPTPAQTPALKPSEEDVQKK